MRSLVIFTVTIVAYNTTQYTQQPLPAVTSAILADLKC
jgi:hypothetical protein